MLDITAGANENQVSKYIEVNFIRQGTPQYIQITFEKPVVPKHISITFQGGFVGTRTTLEIPIKTSEGSKPEWQPWTSIYPEDVNRAQTFDLSPQEPVGNGVVGLRLVFQESSDFFGRITVYNLEIDGDIL